LISIIGPDQVRDATPISLFDVMQKIFRVAINLTRWLPQPDAIQTDRESQDESSKPFGPKINAHKSICRSSQGRALSARQVNHEGKLP